MKKLKRIYLIALMFLGSAMYFLSKSSINPFHKLYLGGWAFVVMVFLLVFLFEEVYLVNYR